VDGYYVGYQRDIYPPEVIDFAALTHLAVGRVSPNPDASLDTTFDIDEVHGPELARRLVQLAHGPARRRS